MCPLPRHPVTEAAPVFCVLETDPKSSPIRQRARQHGCEQLWVFSGSGGSPSWQWVALESTALSCPRSVLPAHPAAGCRADPALSSEKDPSQTLLPDGELASCIRRCYCGRTKAESGIQGGDHMSIIIVQCDPMPGTKKKHGLGGSWT